MHLADKPSREPLGPHVVLCISEATAAELAANCLYFQISADLWSQNWCTGSTQWCIPSKHTPMYASVSEETRSASHKNRRAYSDTSTGGVFVNVILEKTSNKPGARVRQGRNLDMTRQDAASLRLSRIVWSSTIYCVQDIKKKKNEKQSLFIPKYNQSVLLGLIDKSNAILITPIKNNLITFLN